MDQRNGKNGNLNTTGISHPGQNPHYAAPEAAVGYSGATELENVREHFRGLGSKADARLDLRTKSTKRSRLADLACRHAQTHSYCCIKHTGPYLVAWHPQQSQEPIIAVIGVCVRSGDGID